MANPAIKLTSEIELESLQIETFVNTTSAVTKVTDHSVLRGLIRGNVRAGKLALKDIALAISHLFVDDASGSSLDEVADSHGISPRFTASQSTTYVRLIAPAGTNYQEGVHVVSDNKGNIFDLQDDITIGVSGYGYVKVRSQQSGSNSNVDPYTIININPIPSGHVGVINEYAATGGRDAEPDDEFRQRIKNGPDILARGTLSYITQAFIKTNPNILRVIYDGVNNAGKCVLSILTVNGMDLTADELQTLLEDCSQYFSLTELNPIGTQSFGIHLQNATYAPIDCSMRLGLFTDASFDVVVKDIQKSFSKYVDHRFWNSFEDKVERSDLLGIVSGTKGVKYVPDVHFTPATDITMLPNVFPRFRGFQIYDLNGNLIINQSGTLQPIFYPNEADQAFITTVL